MRQLLGFGVALALFVFVHSMPDFCKLPQDGGIESDLDVNIYLYYDAEKDICYPFRFSGVGGNGNRFSNERECMRNCSARAEQVYPMDERISCRFPKAIGECHSSYLRFYYDSHHDKCKNFLFSGCLGNGNRFLDRQSCNATCAGIHDEGDVEEEDEPDTPIALIFGILFGILGAIIIIVVVVLTVQSKKSSKGETKKNNPEPREPKAEVPLQGEVIEMA